jgi:hypothetical protein
LPPIATPGGVPEMLTLGPFAFAAPLVLIALAALPILAWLLRVTPPTPRLLRFPAVRLLSDLEVREETPHRTPWWILALRLLVAGLVILGLARPIVDPAAALPGSGPLLLVVDTGWAAGRGWPARQQAMNATLDRAERDGRDVMLLATASSAPGEPLAPTGLMRPAEARAAVAALAPRPWPTDRAVALAVIDPVDLPGSVPVVWVTDGITGAADRDAALHLAARLQQFGSLDILQPAIGNAARLIGAPVPENDALVVPVRRADAGAEQAMVVRASAVDGRVLARTEIRFAAGEGAADARFALPFEARNRIVSVAVEDDTTAGSTLLVDEQWRRRPVGIVAATASEGRQPLLSDAYYLARALEPFAEVRRGRLADLLAPGPAGERRLTTLLLPDSGTPTAGDAEALERWIASGGVLVRFAGPLLAANPDGLMPVPLRYGDRFLSGALSWSEPMPLAPFDAASPFHDLAIPTDVRIDRQVLADPSPGLASRTWAKLADGTPLVTAEKRGEGWLVLVHTTAGPEWSNLALSGLFVEMLRRMSALGSGVGGATGLETLPPIATLDGLGRLGTPPATAQPIAGADFAATTPGPAHPPGFYGADAVRRALNLAGTVPDLERLDGFPAGVSVAGFAGPGQIDLSARLLAAAMALLALDLLVALGLRGLLTPALRRRASAAGLIAFAFLLGATVPSARAQDSFALEAADRFRLAYVVTGDGTVDAMSDAGLAGLARVVGDRTSAVPEGSVGVDVERDDLAFFSFLYWPVTPAQPDLSDTAIAKLNSFMATGGTILFDTRDQEFGGDDGPGAARLREISAGLDIPPLAPVPPDHVLTRAFYLMQDFPGRYDGGTVWVESADASVNDGVSRVIIGANDWAGAWAMDETGVFRQPVTPGGERQREMAFRFGVNLVIYALTGNYKADQVHVPAILERLGQ